MHVKESVKLVNKLRETGRDEIADDILNTVKRIEENEKMEETADDVDKLRDLPADVNPESSWKEVPEKDAPFDWTIITVIGLVVSLVCAGSWLVFSHKADNGK
jgi:hypothetical protein